MVARAMCVMPVLCMERKGCCMETARNFRCTPGNCKLFYDFYHTTCIRDGTLLLALALGLEHIRLEMIPHALGLKHCVFNPQCACAARVTAVVLCVCLCVGYPYSSKPSYSASYQRLQQL